MMNEMIEIILYIYILVFNLIRIIRINIKGNVRYIRLTQINFNSPGHKILFGINT